MKKMINARNDTKKECLINIYYYMSTEQMMETFKICISFPYLW